MKVYFIGAGPGAKDLITVRGAKIIGDAPLVMYAGSLVSEDHMEYCGKNAEIVDTSELNLEQQTELYLKAKDKDWDVARVHSGDPSIYGATSEQMKRLEELGISYEVVPGVSSFSASAAVLNAELTKPGVSQTIVLTRFSGRASSVPEPESIARLASHHATMCIFLSGPLLPKVIVELRKHYAADTPVVLVQKATWPQERVHRGTLENVLGEIKLKEWALSTMILVGDVLKEELPEESKLYSADYTHRFRKKVKKEKV